MVDSNKQSEFHTNEEYRALTPEISQAEYRALKDSIKRNGLYHPITVNSSRIILDGHTRYKICRELKIAPKVTVLELEDDLAEKEFVIESNLHRRQLSFIQKVEMAMRLEELEKERARRRRDTWSRIGSNEHILLGRARDVVAKRAGLSPTTYHRAKAILEKGDLEIKDKLKQGKVSVAYAYKMLKKEERGKETFTLPVGKYEVILADPPWEYRVPLRGDPSFHYATMTTEEIEGLEVPSADNAVLFLWATNPKLEDALRVMESWGYKYDTNAVWVKDKIGTGYLLRGMHELLLIGIRGKVEAPAPANRPKSVIYAPRTKHSEKPEEAYLMIEKMYPNKSKIELFARKRRTGWVAWGKEAPQVQ